MAPQYKLTYFNGMGIAEPSRLVFAAAKVEYEDVRIEHDDWSKLKPSTPWGQLPILEVNGVTISQSSTIARYLGRKFGFVGDNEIEAAKIDEYIDVVQDLRKEVQKHHDHSEDTEVKAKYQQKLIDEILPGYFDKFTKILEKQGNGYLVGKRLSLADIFVAYSCGKLLKTVNPNLLDNYEVIKKYIDGVNNQPGIKEWIQKRLETKF